MLRCLANELVRGDCDTYGRSTTQFDFFVSIRGTKIVVKGTVTVKETSSDYTTIIGRYSKEYSLHQIVPNYNSNMYVSISNNKGDSSAQPCWKCFDIRRLPGNGIINHIEASLDNPQSGCDVGALGGDVFFNEIIIEFQ